MGDRQRERINLFQSSVVYRDAGALASALGELEGAFEAAGVAAWTVWVPDGEPAAAALLADAGHRLDAEPVAMVRELADLSSPDATGLDWGAVTPEEIALSILAEILQRRRQSLVSNSPSSSNSDVAADSRVTNNQLPTDALDPVCGMTVEIATAYFTSEYNGKTYYFCAAGCKRSFHKEPGKYIQPESSLK